MYRYLCPIAKGFTVLLPFYPAIVKLESVKDGENKTIITNLIREQREQSIFPVKPVEKVKAERQRPLPLVQISPGKVKIDTRVLNDLLNKIGDKPFAVYSMNGPARTGKSYLLSRCLEYLKGQGQAQENAETIEDETNVDLPKLEFEWRGDSTRCTIGINIWPEPFYLTLENGDTIPILLLDCQGCFDDKTPMNQDAKLFAISTLISSVHIFNVMKSIDEATLQFLEAFTGIASMAKVYDASSNGINSYDFQKLIILVRDFQFADYDFGYHDNATCPNKSKNFKLDKIDPQTTQPEELQHVRATIQESFEHVAAYLMPYPGKSLTREDNPEHLDEDFEQYQDDFIKSLFNPENIVKKTVNGFEVTGTEFKKHIARWTETFEKQEFPDLKRCAEANAELQYLTAIQTAASSYKEAMTTYTGGHKYRVSEDELNHKHNILIDSCCRIFSQKFILRKNLNEKRFQEELDRLTKEMYAEFQKQNLDKWDSGMYYLNTTWEFLYKQWKVVAVASSTAAVLLLKLIGV